jgi:hypothetical protein
MSDPFKNPDQFGAELGAVKYTPAAQGRPQAIDRPSNWGQFSVTERRAFQLEEQRLQQAAANHQGALMVSQLASGQLDILNFDSGYSDGANEGVLYASNLLNPSFSGFHAVDAGQVATHLFPIV